jgi:hypothetical protein
MVSIANNAGNVYVRGGVGAAGQRASVMGDKIYIATGNVGNIAFEASAPNQEHKNVAGGDDVHMLTVNTSPAAAVSIGATVTTTAPGLSPSYSYSALTETDGVACLWLPAGSQTVSANGYNSASGTIENTNTALVTLTQKQAGGGGSSAPTYSANVSSGGTLPVTVNQASGSASVTANAALGESVLGGGNEVITMPAIAGVTSYSLGIPVAYLSTPGGGTLTFSTDTGSMTLPADMLSGVPGAEGKKAAITIGAGDKAGLSEEAKSAIGARPLITLSLMLDGVQADWSNPGAPVSVSIPYTPTAAELENPESIILWYIDGAGNLSCIPNGRFDPATGRVTFSVTHFSLYAVGYNSVRFSDVTEGAWYADAVNFIAARGITGGTGGGSFSPEAKLTRGQFIIMLLRACEIAPDANPSDNFSDAGNTYYTGYLAAAKRLGISAGVGDNKFAPEKELTRQELFTLLHNALKALGQLPQGESGKKLSDFPDGGEIADWAKAAMGLLVEAGTVDGRSGRLNPAGTMTRAEMAQVLYKLLSK